MKLLVASSVSVLMMAGAVDNVEQIICPFLSSMVNSSLLPVKAKYSEAELRSLTVDAGLPSLFIDGHINGNFKKIPLEADGVKRIDIFNMEGLPNEHKTSTGINDCVNTYDQSGTPTKAACALPNENFFNQFWKVAAMDGDPDSMSYADLAAGAEHGLFKDLDPSFPGNLAEGTIAGAFSFLLDVAKDNSCSMSRDVMWEINIKRKMPMAFTSKFPAPTDVNPRPGCTETIRPFICRDGWESNFQGLLSDVEYGTGITEETCLLNAMNGGYQGYYYDWNPTFGGWCRMVIDADAQSERMARPISWVDWASSHTCIRNSSTLPALDVCLQSGDCKLLPTVSEVAALETESMACRNGYVTNFHLILGAPALVGNSGSALTEEQCKHAALKQGFFGYYYDWGYAGGWCQFVIDASQQGEQMNSVDAAQWTDYDTSHTCVLLSKSEHLQPCVDEKRCELVVGPIICRDGYEGSFQYMLSNIEWGTGITEETCLLNAMNRGHHGYNYEWNPVWGGWCRMVIDEVAQSESMADSNTWVDWQTSHTCIRSSSTLPALDICLDSGNCKLRPTMSQVAALEKESMVCRDGRVTFHSPSSSSLADPPLVGNAGTLVENAGTAITEEQCKHAALKQGYFGYYFDWSYPGGWCRFVRDAIQQGEQMNSPHVIHWSEYDYYTSSDAVWIHYDTSHTCVLLSKSEDLQPCVDEKRCELIVGASRRLNAQSSSFMV